MTSSAKKTPSLRAVQMRLKETITTFGEIWRFVENFDADSTTTSQIRVRLEMLDGLWEQFNEAIIAVKSHDDYPADEAEDRYAKERMEFTDQFYQAKAFLLDHVKGDDAVEVSMRANESTSGHPTVEHIRLPQIKLQSFSGNIDEWLSFRDLFSSLIHWQHGLPEVEKFHYLKGCLQGEPRSLIDPLPVTKTNYQLAWDMLQKRYHNSKQLRKRQVQTLFSATSLAKEGFHEMHTLLETFERTVKTLDQLLQPADYKDLLLSNLLISKLDSVTRRAWEEFSSSKEQDSFSELCDFLRRRVQVLEYLPSKSSDNKTSQQPQPSFKQKPTTSKASCSCTVAQKSESKCVQCKENHFLHQCPAFQKLSVSDRDGVLKKQSLCRNCLRSGHQAKDCRSKFNCRTCKGRHHSLVCFKSDKERRTTELSTSGETPSTSSTDTQGQKESTTTQVANLAATQVCTAGATQPQSSSKVLLATAVVIIEDDNEHRIPARVLLDSGSESNFISERLVRLMSVKREKVDISVSGIGQADTKVKHRVHATVRSRVSQFSRDMSFLVLQKVTINLPTTSIATDGWSIPDGIKLADPTFFQSNRVDIVLGIECFFEFFETGRRITLGDHLPSLHDSVFGWVVCGGLSDSTNSLQVNCNVSTTEDLDSLMARFWSAEDVGLDDSFSPLERRCEELFQNTVQRLPDGRYSVSMPMIEDGLTRIGDSKEIALRRLQGTERRLARDAGLRKQYTAFMEEYLNLNHMRKVDETASDQSQRCFLPHHPVVKEESTTTKVRVVFDASCRTSSGASLNDVLLAGPVIQEDLRSIIMRSRTKQIMIVADVEKMFRQVWIHQEQRPLQSILWRFSTEEPVAVYELNTITYGTKPAPFLATRTLKQLTIDEESRFPLGAKSAREDTYMDDVITGADDVESATTLRKQLDEMTISCGFKLRKWASNCADVLVGIPEENLAVKESDTVSLDRDPAVKTLGLTWLPKSDTLRFRFNIQPLDSSAKLSKRVVLSAIAFLFDPLGFLGPTITMAKIFMQSLWLLKTETGEKLDWDDPLPATVGEKWRRFHEKLPILNEISIKRCVIIPEATSIEIHCFSDASERAFGCCIYIRSQDADGQVMVQLLTSRSKVAPLENQSIPRLELRGALLAAEAYVKMRDSIRISPTTHFWVDSMDVLYWVNAVPSTWATFIANRVAKIQRLTEGCKWNHVPGKQNPADLISRGIAPEDIVDNKFWWHGPDWLTGDPSQRPDQPKIVATEDAKKEARRTAVGVTATVASDFNNWFIGKYSSYPELIRRTAYWLRLMKLLRMPRETRSNTTFLSTEELREAEFLLIRRVQRECFADDWERLSKGQAVSKKSRLRWYNTYISDDQLIRVGGRLRHSLESEDTKHPIVLPDRHPLTRLLMRHYHEKLLHAGPQLVLGVIRLRYWPLGGRSVIRHIIHQCQKCFRSKPRLIEQFMGELPHARVTTAPPFSRTGVDYFGPFYVRQAPRKPVIKVYAAVFVCLCTKAVHLELVSDLSTERFIQALRRFIGRRGYPADMYSDNGTNFVGARNELRQLFKLLQDEHHRDAVSKECSSKGINWHFNPPSAPHFGGLWEAAVRSAKTLLLKVMGETVASPEDLQTLLVQVEACLNSRPLTPLTDDPNDLQPLTPGHFLIGGSLQAIPDPNYSSLPLNRLNQYQLMQRKLQDFWKRWRKEYLCQLQTRIKRWNPPISVEVGKLVIIKDDNLPPLRWKMGRIQELHPGDDGVVRVVTLKTGVNGTLKRPVDKLCILPLPDYNDDFSSSEKSTQL